MLGLKLNHISERGHCTEQTIIYSLEDDAWCMFYTVPLIYFCGKFTWYSSLGACAKLIFCHIASVCPYRSQNGRISSVDPVYLPRPHILWLGSLGHRPTLEYRYGVIIICRAYQVFLIYNLLLLLYFVKHGVLYTYIYVYIYSWSSF